MRKTFPAIIIGSVMLTLTACGGGGGNASSEKGTTTLTPSSTPSTNNNTTTTTTNTPTTPTNRTSTTPSANTGNTANRAGNSVTPSILPPASIIEQTVVPSITPPTTGSTVDKFRVKPIAADLQAQVAKVVENTNKLRAEKGLSPLRYDEKLSAFAQRRAEQVVGRYDHILPDSELKLNSEVNAAENLAGGAVDADEAVLVQWRNSKDHYDNLMTANYETIGVGIIYVPGSKYTYYWVQLFGIDGVTVSNYYFDTSPSAKQNLLADTTEKTISLTQPTKWLRVDGTDISLHDVIGDGTWHQINQGNHSGSVNGYANTRFGVIKNGAGLYKGFYQGNNTAYENMPQTGSATYTGSAVISDGVTVNTNVSAQFNADFSAKKLNGTLTENNQKLMDIHATIRGTSFYSPENAPVATQGGFFGTHADEVGGVFYEASTDKRGAFSAKK